MRWSTDESSFKPSFRRHPIQDICGTLEHNDTLFVLFNGPYRVFLHTEHKSRIFYNVWLLNGFLIFRGWCHATLSCGFLSEVYLDSFGVLEGEQIVRVSSTRYILRRCEWPMVHYDYDSDSGSRLNHTYLPPIVTTPLVNLLLDEAFEDWTALIHLSHTINIHIYGLRGSHESRSILVCFRASSFSDTTYQSLHRTHLHHLQCQSDLNTRYYTSHGLSVYLTMIYSWIYSTTTEWLTRIPGMSDLGGASSLTFVRDGVG